MNDFVLWQGDYLEWLKGLEGESVDRVVADPPYGIGYRSYWMTRSSGVPRTTRRDFGKDVMQVAWMDEVFRVLKNDSLVYQPGVPAWCTSLVYCFTRWDVMQSWRDAFLKAGFRAGGGICSRARGRYLGGVRGILGILPRSRKGC